MSEESMQAVLESIDSKLDLVFEGFTALDRKIDKVRENLETKIDQCNFKIDVLNEKIDTVEARLNEKIDKVEARLNGKIDTVEDRLSARLNSVEIGLHGVADELAAHRADTEGHRGSYRVRE